MHFGSIIVLAGIASHVDYFSRGEHHMYGTNYLQIFIGVFIAAFSTFARTGSPVAQALLTTTALATYYLFGVYGSLVIHRIFFSPLRDFPGSIGVKLSSLTFSLNLGKGDSHRQLLSIHQKYGDFVRIGSSDLSIIHPKATSAIYGRGSKCTKAEWYDLTLPMISMQTTRRRAEHDKRRRIWGGAFNDAMLQGYEDRISQYQDQLIDYISDRSEKPVNVTESFKLYSFDVMGDLAFGASFNMLRDNQQHWAVELLHKGMEPLGLMLPTWCFRLLLAIPGASGDWFKFKDYCCQRLIERMKTKVETPNIMSFLLEPWKDKEPIGSDMNMLQGDSQLILVAGSDTTASALTSTLFELAKAPSRIGELRSEIDSLVKGPETISNQKLQSLESLNGVISETLRLYPPSGIMQRKTPPEGLMIGETYIPGNTTVFCPQYVAARSEDIYTDASNFRPERWSTHSEMVKEPSAYSPFSTGTYNCIGKSLALLNLRTTLAKLILNFDMSFAPGEDGTAFEEKATTQFTTRPGDLYLNFKKRRA